MLKPSRSKLELFLVGDNLRKYFELLIEADKVNLDRIQKIE